jgi:hypothetical protein
LTRVAAIVSLNLARRHLTQTQRAVLAAEVCSTVEQTVRESARTFGVSATMVSQASTVLRYCVRPFESE